ncbi:MAG: hypothetical protein LBQ79_10345 [Deltaproteobacteria bacterium]|jgi:hypothetical protein|nr:hypothetical protein [Deltaproteobacteria bacterium]
MTGETARALTPFDTFLERLAAYTAQMAKYGAEIRIGTGNRLEHVFADGSRFGAEADEPCDFAQYLGEPVGVSLSGDVTWEKAPPERVEAIGLAVRARTVEVCRLVRPNGTARLDTGLRAEAHPAGSGWCMFVPLSRLGMAIFLDGHMSPFLSRSTTAVSGLKGEAQWFLPSAYSCRNLAGGRGERLHAGLAYFGVKSNYSIPCGTLLGWLVFAVSAPSAAHGLFRWLASNMRSTYDFARLERGQ